MAGRLEVVYTSGVYGEDGFRRMHDGDAGLDLRCTRPVVVVAHDTRFVPCGIRVRLPEGTFGAIRSRSGLARKHGIGVIDGTVDENFTGDVGVTLVNHSGKNHFFNTGDRIAQMVVIPYDAVETVEVESLVEDARRGDAGYGSTGVE